MSLVRVLFERWICPCAQIFHSEDVYRSGVIVGFTFVRKSGGDAGEWPASKDTWDSRQGGPRKCSGGDGK